MIVQGTVYHSFPDIIQESALKTASVVTAAGAAV